MKRLFVAVLLVAGGLISGCATIHKQPVEYRANGTVLKGYLAYDPSIKGRRPGVLVVHEWWGLNDYARRRADMLAKLGYTALAVDMYGDGRQARHPDEAGKFAGQVRKNMGLAKARFMAAYDLLRAQPTVDPDRIAAIGYCFGGGVVLEMARRGVPLDAVVSFHGSLAPVQPAQPGMVKAKLLVLTGGADKFVPPEQVAKFRREMDQAGADYRVVVYPGALHSFTNPQADAYGKKFNLPLAYNAEADQASWQAMQQLFKQVFAP